MRNTKEKALIHFAIIPGKKKGWFVAICFELGLVEEGNDFFSLRNRISKVAREYFKVVAEDNELSDDLLNQSLAKEYENLYKTVKEEMEAERLKKKWEKEINKVLAWTRVVGELQKV